jgi:hypothetical protein
MKLILLYLDILRFPPVVYTESRGSNGITIAAITIPTTTREFRESMTLVISIFETIDAEHCCFMDSAIITSKH